MMKEMKDGINDHYEELLTKMTKFIDKHIDSDNHKDEILVKAVLEVIEQDESINNEQEFYICPNGKSVTKIQLIPIKMVYLPSFILGILYYVLMNIKDNKYGAATYDEWCPKPTSGTRRKYTANLGIKSTRQIELLNTPEEHDDCESSRIKQSERIDEYDTVLVPETIVVEKPSLIPFITKKVKTTRYVEKRKKRKPE